MSDAPRKMLHQCPGCWGWSSHEEDRTWECECGERLSRIDLRNPEPSPFAIEAQARPAVAAEGLRAALERLVTINHSAFTILHHPCPCPEHHQARAALASDAGSVGALDVERLARALEVEWPGWLEEAPNTAAGRAEIREYAAGIAAAYDAERQGEDGA